MPVTGSVIFAGDDILVGNEVAEGGKSRPFNDVESA